MKYLNFFHIKNINILKYALFLSLLLGCDNDSKNSIYNDISNPNKEIIFEDIYDSTNNWNSSIEEYNYDPFFTLINKQLLFFSNKKGNKFYKSLFFLPTKEWGNYEIETTVKLTNKDTSTFCGLIWGAGNSNNIDRSYFAFLISNNEIYLGEYNTEWIPWKFVDSTSIESKLISEDFNKLTIRKIEGEYLFFLNEKLIYNCYLTSQLNNEYGIGFGIGNNSGIRSSYLKIYKLDWNIFMDSRYKFFNVYVFVFSLINEVVLK